MATTKPAGPRRSRILEIIFKLLLPLACPQATQRRHVADLSHFPNPRASMKLRPRSHAGTSAVAKRPCQVPAEPISHIRKWQASIGSLHSDPGVFVHKMSEQARILDGLQRTPR